MSCWAWPVITDSVSPAAMFAKLSDTLSKLVCGISPPTTAAEDRYRAGLRSLLLLPPSPERSSSSSRSASVRSKAPPEHDDGGGDEMATSPPAMSLAEPPRTEEAMASSTLPCVAFASEHGYKIFSLAGADAGEVVTTPMAPVVGRRLIPSPYGGNVLATDVCYNHPCHVINPFTGERAALPDLPIPFSEKEPIRFHPDDHPPFSSRAVTDDGLAWDWSPHGVMVARGDTAFFFDSGGDTGEWTPVHQSAFGSPMTVNYRGGSFFILELRSLATKVIDACTLRVRAEIPPPSSLHRHVIDAAYLAPSSPADEAILLVHFAGDERGVVFTEAYRWKDKTGDRRRGSPQRWSRVHDIGDHAVFVDGAHAFTVDAGDAGAAANGVYVLLTNSVAQPCGGRGVVYAVGYSDLMRPERLRRMVIDVGEVEPMWGQPHWIIRSDGSDRRCG